MVAQRSDQIWQLHEELRDELEALRRFEEARRNARLEARSRVIRVVLGLVTAIIIPMQLVAALFPATVSKWPFLKGISPSHQQYGAIVLVLFLALLTTVLFLQAGRPRR